MTFQYHEISEITLTLCLRISEAVANETSSIFALKAKVFAWYVCEKIKSLTHPVSITTSIFYHWQMYVALILYSVSQFVLIGENKVDCSTFLYLLYGRHKTGMGHDIYISFTRYNVIWIDYDISVFKKEEKLSLRILSVSLDVRSSFFFDELSYCQVKFKVSTLQNLNDFLRQVEYMEYIFLRNVRLCSIGFTILWKKLAFYIESSTVKLDLVFGGG